VYVAAEVSAGVAAAFAYTLLARTAFDRKLEVTTTEDYVSDALAVDTAA
jgi:hypothetical protein